MIPYMRILFFALQPNEANKSYFDKNDRFIFAFFFVKKNNNEKKLL
jgi:hypothetical protein